jgi:hypothetical protein
MTTKPKSINVVFMKRGTCFCCHLTSSKSLPALDFVSQTFDRLLIKYTLSVLEQATCKLLTSFNMGLENAQNTALHHNHLTIPELNTFYSPLTRWCHYRTVTKDIRSLRHPMFSQWYRWALIPSGIWQCVVGWVLPDIFRIVVPSSSEAK